MVKLEMYVIDGGEQRRDSFLRGNSTSKHKSIKWSDGPSSANLFPAALEGDDVISSASKEFVHFVCPVLSFYGPSITELQPSLAEMQASNWQGAKRPQ